MKLLERLRSRVFWVKDYLKNGTIKSHYNDIKFIIEHPRSNISVQKRNTYLKDLIAHVVKTVPFYAKLNPNLKLEDFPVINKHMINRKKEDFISKTYLHKKKIVVSTSGSSGTPFKMYMDKNKKNRNTADTLYFAKQAGFNLGERLYYWRHWNEYYRKSKLLNKIQNIEPIEVFNLNDIHINKILNLLKNDPSKKHFLGYASAFETICKYLDSRPEITTDDIKIESIIAMSERLSKYTKERMEYYFNAPTVSRYSNTENGIIAQQSIYTDDEFYINWASYHVEILDLEEDVPVGLGTLGRIVVTDLFNYCSPMIRYDTGDLGVMDIENSFLFLRKIEGRKADAVYNTKGEIISSLITLDFSLYKEIKLGQLIQNGKKEYTILLKVNGVFNFENQLIARFREYLGVDSSIQVEYVDDIPLLPSGKRKLTVNNYIKEYVPEVF